MNNNESFESNVSLKTNEFNDTTIGYNKNNDDFYSTSTPKKNNKMLYIGGGIVILVLGIAVIAYVILANKSKLTDIEVVAPDIIYVGEESGIKATAIGENDLSATVYNFSVSDISIAKLVTTSTITGITGKNSLLAISSGRFNLSVSASLKGTTTNKFTKEIIVCKKLYDSSFNDVTVVEGETLDINVDLGTETECYSNLTYEIENQSIATISNDTILGVKAGTTKINIKNEEDTITKNITVTSKIVIEKPKEEVKVETNPNTNVETTMLYILVFVLISFGTYLIVLKNKNKYE